MSDTPTARSWRSMRERCDDAASKDFHKYGARGICVCARWASLAAFIEDMGARPLGTTLDRIDNDGNYEPGNCRWATPREQGRNTRQNVLVTYLGRTQCVTAWAEEVGLEPKTLQYRIRAGWPADRALTTPSLINRKSNHGCATS
ncbi:hypothetical protein H4CHR_01548 [Variovorax sp. PBS-H4]|nr:hypothetical protein H4CHR_01548 [Variovorax sp. PBS-H4]